MNAIGRSVVGLATLAGTAIVGFVGSKLIDRYHYDEDGYNSLGFDRDGYNRAGFARDGFDCEGFDDEGYDRDGYDWEGYSRQGLDIDGFNREGLDNEGYDRLGYNVQGFDRRGLDRDGFDAHGYDSKGFDRRGYNALGEDRSGHDSEYYETIIAEMRQLARKAHGQMKQGEFAYALRDIRVDTERVLKAIIEHKGKGLEEFDNLSSMISKCRRSKFISEELCEKLDGLRGQCNDTQHDTRKEKNYDQVHFCYMTLNEAIDRLEALTQ